MFLLKNNDVMEDNRDENEIEEQSQRGVPQDEMPEIVKEEPDDKPAGLTIQWTIFIAVVLLAIIYFVFIY